ncbi:protein of unknown function [Kyrpidia spormannii]|uniref:Uncharacterized protein n=1 Tax=Kyrpidia spormannii TaxID=2055160 RepID=A0A6F9E8J2_9BACL|nr:protein of unknown function [Kyrpidia spormannii]
MLCRWLVFPAVKGIIPMGDGAKERILTLFKHMRA